MDTRRAKNQEISSIGDPAYQQSQVSKGATKYSVMKMSNVDNIKIVDWKTSIKGL